MKKTVCFFLALLMLLPLTVACADDKEPNDSTVTTAEVPGSVTTAGDADTTGSVTEKLQPDLPDVKYNGYSFTVANDFADSTKYTTNAIRSDDQNGEPVNDALYYRTLLIEDKFGVKIVDTDIDLDPIKNTISSGEDAFTIATIDLSHIMSMVNAGYAIDFHDIDTIDLSMPWWDQNAQEKLSFDGHLYYTFSDFLITGLDNSRATYFNKSLITDLSLENPYELVREGKWTIEKMRTMAVTAVRSLDGDDKITVNDRVGIANNATTFYEAMLTGCNAEIVKQGDDGIPYFCCFNESEFFINVYQTLLSQFGTDNLYLITSTEDGRNMFINGNALFTVDTLMMASKSRQEDVDFGILPIAKFNESQEDYMHVSPNPHSIMVPVTTKDVSRTGVLLEALSYYSSPAYSDDALIPSYYEIALKYKSSTDNESAEMLSIIHDNISYVIKIVGTTFSDQIFSYFAAGKNDISSLLKKMESTQKKLLTTTIENMRKSQ